MAQNKGKPKANREKTPKNKRVTISDEVRLEVLRKCRRRCCMCYFLKKIDIEAKGQIAHLDQNHQNPEPDNLAFLCLACHRDYDVKSNRTVGYSAEEIKHYRDRLHLAISPDQVE